MKTSIRSISSISLSRRALQIFSAVAVLVLAGSSLRAQLLSYEPFNQYPVGTVVPNDVPSPATAGYTSNWTTIDYGTQWPTVIAGPLTTTDPGYAAGSGNHIGVPYNTTGGQITAANSGRMYRLLDNTLKVTSASTGTIYMSFLYQNGMESPNVVYQMLDLYNGDTADADRTFTAGLTSNGGQTGNQYDFGVNETYYSLGVNADTNAHLFVVKFVLGGGISNSTVTVWLDPTLGAGDPAGGVTVANQTIAFDRLAFSDYFGNSCNWGEIRWGTTFASVTSAALPSAAALPTLTASPRVASVGQTVPLTVTIPANVNATSTVQLVLTNDNTGILSLPGGNPSTTTLTFNAGATNAQTINVSVIGDGAGNVSVMTNSTFYAATIRLGSVLNASEEFDYTADGPGSENLPGMNGGTGFSGAWDANNILAAGSVVSPGLTNGGLVVAGNAAQVFAENAFRQLIATHDGAGEGTIWISFLAQRVVADGQWGGVSLFNGSSEAFFMGTLGGNYGFASQFNGPASDTNTVFLVYRLDFPSTNGGNVNVSLYANPVLGITPPLTPTDSGTVSDFQFDSIRLGTGGTFNFDEIRMGTDWTNVVPFVGPPPPPVPSLNPVVKFAPVGQDDVVQLVIPTNVNASSPVNITITNDNPAAFSLPGGNPASTTLTFAAGATNVQTFNVHVLAQGFANLTVVSNAQINTASVRIASQVSAWDSFQYNTGTLNGDNGGTGYSGAWSDSTATASVIPGLAYPGLLTSSNAAQVTANGNGFRSLPETYGGVGGGTVWVSFLIQGAVPGAFTNATYGGLSLFNGGSAGAEEFFMGLSTYVGNNGMYGFIDNAGGVANFFGFTNSVAPATNTALLVYRLDFPPTNGGPMEVTFYANPPLGINPPSVPTGTATANSFQFDTIRIGTGNTMNFDEVRLGANWGDVVAAPYLGIQRVGGNVQVAWPAAVGTVGNPGLNSATSLLGPWSPTGLSVTTSNGNSMVNDTIGGATKFYRLH